MRYDNSLDTKVGEFVEEYYRKKADGYEPSGKLSASILGWPLQWQVLKYLGVPQPPKENYVLRKFIRGEQVEEFIVNRLDGLIDRQVKVEYRNAIGYVDALVENKNKNIKDTKIPHEVKSTSNAKYARVMKMGVADEPHKFQAGFYALALGTQHFAIDYVATDDYRTTTFIYDTADVKPQIDKIIDEYESCIKAKEVPVFVPRYEWQKNSQYNNYPEFMGVGPIEIARLLEKYKCTWERGEVK